MKPILTVFMLFSVSTVLAKTADQFGAPLTLKTAIPLEKAIEQISAGKPLLVEAQVDKVCQKKGCFMELKSAKGDVRVTFKDYGFFVPFSLAGKNVWVEGKMSEKKLSLEQTKHYVQDVGGDPNSVTEGRSEFQIVATGVLVKN